MPIGEDAASRLLSRRVFGQEHRLAVLLAINRQDRHFSQSDIASATGVRSTSSIQRAFAALREVRLILPVRGEQASKLFMKAESSIWILAEELYAGLDGQQPLPFE